MKKILFVGGEAVPFASTGGLGDVMGSLPEVIGAAYTDVRVAIPLYGGIAEKYRNQMKLLCEFTVHLSWRQQGCRVYSYQNGSALYYFIDNEYYFGRDSIYGQYDDGERYAFFCHAVLDMLPIIGFFPDVLHANDWHAALTVIYLKQKYSADPRYADIKTVYTIHNIDYQGIFDFAMLGDVFDLPYEARPCVEFDGCINLAKGAMVLCDCLTTVSDSYASELQSPYFSGRLSAILCQQAYKTKGIVNGIDTASYDPSADPSVFPYSAADLSGKEKNKRELERMFGWEARAQTPVIAMISRLAAHKGFDLVQCVLEEMLSWDIRFVLLGTGDEALEGYFSQLARRYPHQVGAVIGFDKALAKQIYAGSDIFLMPSKSEPCGISQMIASAYGTVPVVRSIGGLADTIHPYNPKTREGNGITFLSYNAHDMMDAVRRAVALYGEPEQWRSLVVNAMSTNFSWKLSAEKYLSIYNDLTEIKGSME